MSGIQKCREGGGRVDLHLHTTNSDGDNTPDEVLRLVARENMRVIALTDYNKYSRTFLLILMKGNSNMSRQS